MASTRITHGTWILKQHRCWFHDFTKLIGQKRSVDAIKLICKNNEVMARNHSPVPTNCVQWFSSENLSGESPSYMFVLTMTNLNKWSMSLLKTWFELFPIIPLNLGSWLSDSVKVQFFSVTWASLVWGVTAQRHHWIWS